MAINPIAPVEALTQIAKMGEATAPQQANFADWVGKQINETDLKIREAETQVQKLALGEADNLPQVMISLARAKTSFELTVQVRNRILEGIQEVMRMSV